MTNADKYLKDGVSVEEFATEFQKWCITNNNVDTQTYYNEMTGFLNELSTPTLTEDERVILRNLHKDFTEIRKTKITSILQIWNEYLGEWVGFNEFDKNLFQFIKERRRIRNKGVAK